MASIHRRSRVDGETYQVRWRLGGVRNGSWQSESFDDPDAAETFKRAVDVHGQQWPPGWIKGQGYIHAPESESVMDTASRFRNFAVQEINDRTGIEPFTRSDYLRILDQWIFPVFGECDVRSAEHFSRHTVARWLRWLEQQEITRGKTDDGKPKTRPMSPKTIRNLHGLLSSILKAAVEHEPPLRARNPCVHSTLPREDDEIEDDQEYLTPQEVALVRSHLPRRRDQILVTVAYGTGLRWSELTALQPRDVLRTEGRAPRLRVQRTWKRPPKGSEAGYRLGSPKTRRSRRTLTLSATVLGALTELGLDKGMARTALFFPSEDGGRLHYSTFWDRWDRAVRAAQAEGLEKRPTPHDLRHSHAAALISAGHSLTYVQRRLGHESITTTSDTYGHLLPEADEAAMETIEATLEGRPRLRVLRGDGPEPVAAAGSG